MQSLASRSHVVGWHYSQRLRHIRRQIPRRNVAAAAFPSLRFALMPTSRFLGFVLIAVSARTLAAQRGARGNVPPADSARPTPTADSGAAPAGRRGGGDAASTRDVALLAEAPPVAVRHSVNVRGQ